MTGKRHHPLIAWLTLVAVCLANTAFAGGVVLCRDGDSGPRIEWGCDRDAGGACQDDDAHEDEGPASDPCQDTPVAGEEIGAAPVVRTTCAIAAPTVAAVLTLRAETHVGWNLAAGKRSERPPDSLCHYRTVVLLV